ncbi:MAG: Cof-type HAD-IIB family hydrolase [Clostridiales bacterium]|nr:Cof-type HAD-IIB family hydrolase [Clostridiales bacterium]
MERKRFFIDLDGTTLRDDKTIPQENIDAIREALDMGHYVAIATGRSLISSQTHIDRLGMAREGCFLVAYNGALIYELGSGTVLLKQLFPDEYARYLFAEAEKYQLYMQAYSETGVLTRQQCPEIEYYARISNTGYHIVPDLYHLETYHTPKVLLLSLDDHAALERFQRDHLERESGKCTSYFSSPEYLEYCRPDSSKGSGIRFFEKYLGIAHENTIAIGDEENDLPMITMAGIGAVMKNAGENIRCHADYITEKDNNEGGVAEVIRKCIAGEISCPPESSKGDL